MDTQRRKAERFRALHEREGAFVIPNPWDPGSARLLGALGFEALATTSSGLANAMGKVDGQVSLEEKLQHCRQLCAATELPISADLEKGYADDPEDVARTILRVAETGVVGASIEDYSGDPERPIYEFQLAVERVHAAVEAARSLDFPFMLTARAENLLHKQNDLDDTILRLQAFEKAGADVLYAPALRDLEQVRAVIAAVNKPVNVLGAFLPDVTVAELAAVGVKRISIGGALSRVGWTALVRAGKNMQEQGSLAWLKDLASAAEIDELIGKG